jgi:very-short-patch-repair endonuclease
MKAFDVVSVDVEGVVLDVLALEAGPTTLEDIHTRLKARLNETLDLDDVAALLYAMSKNEQVKVTPDRKWRALTKPPKRARESRETDPMVSSEVRSKPWEVRQDGSNSGRTSTKQGGTELTFGSRTGSTKWTAFRRLCRYYIDCLRAEGAPNLYINEEQRGNSWIEGPLSVNWSRLESDTGLGFTLPITDEHVGFVKNGKAASNGDGLFLCYPCEVFQPKDKDKAPYILPIVLWPLSTTWSLEALSCKAEGLFHGHNGWLERSHKKRDDQRTFLELVGLDHSAGEEADFEQVIENLEKVLKAKLQESLDPANLSATPTSIKKLRPGVYNFPLLVQAPRLKYSQGVVNDLLEVAKAPDESLDRSVLRFIYGPDAMAPTSSDRDTRAGLDAASSDLLELKTLNSGQRDAVAHTLRENLTVITGPPGTGKSEVVRTIMANQAIRQESTLLASKNHAAIAAVVPQLNQLVDPEILVETPGAKDQTSTFKWKDVMKRLLSKPQVGSLEVYAKLWAGWEDALSRQREILEAVEELEALAVALSGETQRLNQVLKELPPSWRDEGRLRQVGPLVQQELPGVQLKLAASLRAKQSLWGRLTGWLTRKARAKERAALIDILSRFPSHFLKNGEGLDELIDSLGTGEPHSEWAFWEGLVTAHECLQNRDNIENEVRALPSRSGIEAELASARADVMAKANALLKAVSKGSHQRLDAETKTKLANIRAALSNFGEKKVRRQLSEHMPALLKIHPLWAITNMSASAKLPLVPGLYDLLVIDEASQCDIATTLPLLYRAKRLCVVGDPNQLAHVSTMKDSTHEAILKQHNLVDGNLQRFTYKVNSVYGLVDTAPLSPDPMFLSEHYRCSPDIASFANVSFYDDRLHVATYGRSWKAPKHMSPGVHWTHVDGEVTVARRRNHSPAEINAVLNEIKRLEHDGYEGTIGVVTPYSFHAGRIRDRVEQEIKHHYWAAVEGRVGTADAFQGDERDLIIYSLCAGPELGFQASFATETNRFNVAITRARAVLHVVGNKEWALSGDGVPGHVRELARRCEPRVPAPKVDLPFESPWERRLYEALRESGIDAVPQYPVGGRRLDLAVLTKDVKLDVEVDGEAYHKTASGHRKADDLWRDHQLQSLGWRVCRFWVYQLREDMEGCVARVASMLKEN